MSRVVPGLLVVGLTSLALGLLACSGSQGTAQPAKVEIDWPDAGVTTPPAKTPSAPAAETSGSGTGAGADGVKPAVPGDS